MSSDPWGRVDETGTVYVRTADGEKVVGSWQAGSPEEALAYFERKYEGLVVEIGLLERRVKTTDLSAKDAQTAIDHLREQVDEHHAVGDLDALRKRLDALVATVESRREERKAQKAKQTRRGTARQGSAGRRGRGAGAERAVAGRRRAAARAGGHLEGPAAARPQVRRRAVAPLLARPLGVLQAPQGALRLAGRAARGGPQAKEKLVAEAESLSGSTDWGPTAARYRELMTDWKAAGRAQREAEDDLWNRFRGAQDVFFAARGEVFAERDAEQGENLS